MSVDFITLALAKNYADKYAGQGKPGKSAYEIAKDHGYPDSEEAWIASLKGEKGDPGPEPTTQQIEDAVAIFCHNDPIYSSLEEKITIIQEFLGYNESDILGLRVDYKNSKFTRLSAAVNLTPGSAFNKFKMYGDRKRCNVDDKGNIIAYYKDRDYSESGNNGQVMVYQPAFYYKVIPIKLEKIEGSSGFRAEVVDYYISDKPRPGFKLHPAFYNEKGNPVHYIFYSAYEGSKWDSTNSNYNISDTQDMEIDSDKLSSIAYAKPISGLTQELTLTNLEKLAMNRGAGWHTENIKTLSAQQLLFMVEYAGMNMQTAIAKGVVDIIDDASYNCASLTGATSDLGNSSGAASSTTNSKGTAMETFHENGKCSVSYRGVENIWGNIWKFINGIIISGNGSQLCGVPYIAEDFQYSETLTENYKPVGFKLPSSGFISAMGYDENYDWLFLPCEATGNDALPVGDYFWGTDNLNGTTIVRFGGSNGNGTGAGPFYVNVTAKPSSHYRTTGGRLVYIPIE